MIGAQQNGEEAKQRAAPRQRITCLGQKLYIAGEHQYIQYDGRGAPDTKRIIGSGISYQSKLVQAVA